MSIWDVYIAGRIDAIKTVLQGLFIVSGFGLFASIMSFSAKSYTISSVLTGIFLIVLLTTVCLDAFLPTGEELERLINIQKEVYDG